MEGRESENVWGCGGGGRQVQCTRRVGVGVLGQMCEVIYGENRQEQQCEGTTTEAERTTKRKMGEV